MEQHNRVQWVYASTNNQELEERYDQWAKDYDSDLDRDFGWIVPQQGAEALARHAPQDASDTRRRGWHRPSGRDSGRLWATKTWWPWTSPKGCWMRRAPRASTESCTRWCWATRWTTPTAASGPSSAWECIRWGTRPPARWKSWRVLPRPDGFVVFSLRQDMYTPGSEFEQQQTEMETLGIWSLAEATEPFQGLPKGEPDVYHQIWVYRVNG